MEFLQVHLSTSTVNFETWKMYKKNRSNRNSVTTFCEHSSEFRTFLRFSQNFCGDFSMSCDFRLSTHHAIPLKNVPFWVPADGFLVLNGTEVEFYEGGHLLEGVYFHSSNREIDGEKAKCKKRSTKKDGRRDGTVISTMHERVYRNARLDSEFLPLNAFRFKMKCVVYGRRCSKYEVPWIAVLERRV